MKERAEMRLGRAMETALAGLMEDPFLAQRVLNAAHMEGEAVVKRKASLGMIVVIVLLLVTVTAAAAGIVFGVMTGRVADMDAKGQMLRWELADKVDFVAAMREAGYAMDEADYASLMDESAPVAQREAAADRIVYARFGAVQEEQNAARVQPRASVMGEAPEAVVIFRERFLAENPEATYYDYLDALGYWLRDEYAPQYEAALPQEQPAVPAADEGALTRERAEDCLRDHLTEVFSWPVDVVEHAVYVSEQDAASGAWHVTTTIPADALKTAFEPVLSHEMITQTAAGYTVSWWGTLLDDGGLVWAESLESLLAAAEETNRIKALHSIYTEEANEIAVRAIAEKYGLSDAEIKRYFVYNGDTYWNDPTCVRMAVLLRTRNNAGAPWDYAAVVNMTTAQVDDVFTAADLTARAQQLADAWDSLQDNEEWLHYLRWYTTWNPYGWYGDMPEEDKAVIREAFLEHAIRQRNALTDKNGYYPLKVFMDGR